MGGILTFNVMRTPRRAQRTPARRSVSIPWPGGGGRTGLDMLAARRGTNSPDWGSIQMHIL